MDGVPPVGPARGRIPTVAIGGFGVDSGFGFGRDAFAKGLFEGSCAIRSISDFSLDGLTTRCGAFLPPGVAGDETMSDLVASFLRMSREALSGETEPLVHGLHFGTGLGNLADLESHYESFFAKGPRGVPPSMIPMNTLNASAARVAREFRIDGDVRTISAACAGGSSALISGFHAVREGRAGRCLAGGADLTAKRSVYAAWERLRVVSQESLRPDRACRPFDRDRKGLVLGEGGAVFLLQADTAGALAFVRGVGDRFGGADMVKVDGDAAVRSMRDALSMASVEPSQVDLVVAHATATRQGDEAEANALRAVFGGLDVPVTAPKGQLGHAMGGSSAHSLAVGLFALLRQELPGVPSFESGDEGIAPNVVRTTRAAPVRHVLVNAFAFGGIHQSVLLSKEPA